MRKYNGISKNAIPALTGLCLLFCMGIFRTALAEEAGNEEEHFIVEEETFLEEEEESNPSQNREKGNSSSSENESTPSHQPDSSKSDQNEAGTPSATANTIRTTGDTTEEVSYEKNTSANKNVISSNSISENRINFRTPPKEKGPESVSVNGIDSGSTAKTPGLEKGTVPAGENESGDENKEYPDEAKGEKSPLFLFVIATGLLIWGTIRIAGRLRIVYGKL